MPVIKKTKPRAAFLPVIVLLVALLVLVRYSIVSLPLIEKPIERAEANRTRIPRVFEDEKRVNDFQQNEQLSEDDPREEEEEEQTEPKEEEGMKPREEEAMKPKEEEETKPETAQTKFCDKRSETDKRFCIFDVGMHKGQDTMQYLAFSPDARVVAMEANPNLANNGKRKFADAIAASRLKLLNVGLVGNETADGEERQKLEFWINKENTVFSSFEQHTGCRDRIGNFMEKGNTTFCTKVEMDTKSCSELVKEYGTPVYMKIDIEGMDRACLQSLGNVPYRSRPKYASIENINRVDIDIYKWLGYRKFKIVNQNLLQVNLTSRDLEGHSGPWGEDAEDFFIGKKWQTREQVLDRLPMKGPITINGKTVKGWYDLHAKM